VTAYPHVSGPGLNLLVKPVPFFVINSPVKLDFVHGISPCGGVVK